MKTKTTLLTAIAMMGMALFSCSTEDEDKPILIIDPVMGPTSPEEADSTAWATDSTDVPTDSAWTYEYRPAKAISLTTEQQALCQQLTTFSWQLLDQLYRQSPTQNILFSPFSIETELGMIINGMQGEGKNELKALLCLNAYEGISDEALNTFFATMATGIEEADNMTRFTSSNAVWHRKDWALNPNFQNALQQDYGVEIFPITFTEQTANDINQWCAEKTHGRIPNLVPKTTSLDVMHLVNAVYFRSNWKNCFHEESTSKASFTTDNGEQQTVDMMRNGYLEREFRYASTDTYQLANLPFNNGAYSMMFILPNETSNIADAIGSIATQGIQYQHLGGRLLHLSLPKFKATAAYLLKDVLTNMGCTLFQSSNESFCLFQNPAYNFAPSGMLHKAFLQIDEAGAEAAAATDTWWDGDSGEEHTYTTIELTFDRPFLYAIIEQSTGYPLFLGYLGHVE